MRTPLCLLLFIGMAPFAASAAAQTPGVAVVKNARFTVITPNLIRMEYAPDGRFVDLPSWFAVNRQVRDVQAKITAGDDQIEIDTGAIQLNYHDDGKPFSAENLQARIKKGGDTVTWTAGLASSQNLGGTIPTLDGVKGPVRLSDGILSRDGWYVLDDSNSALFADDWIKPRPQNGGSDLYLFGYGLDYPAAFRSLTAVGGAVPLPRKYTLGVWYSRYWPYSADEFKKIVQEYDQHGFPLDNIVMDMDWHLNKTSLAHVNTWTGYTWDRNLIPDPRELLKWFHDQGLHVTLNDHPSAGIQPHEEMYADFMRAMGEDPASGKTIPFDAGSKKYLDTFYRESHLPREKDGVDFWWLDWQQFRKTRSLPEVTNLQLLNFYNYTRTGEDGQRGQSFSRWAGWGDHRYPIQFSGDADTGWKMLAFEVPFTSTGGNMGAFFWSNDIGGHMGGRNEESYARWCQFGAFSAALRSHSTRRADMDRRPWAYPDWAEGSMRRSFRLRSEMMPYLYTSIWQATETSVPFLRPLYIQYPDIEEAYHNGQEYLFGDNLLVAPITQPGVGPGRVASQSVWIPPGDWYDFFTGEKYTGPTRIITAHPIDTFPLFVRGGVPLPMQPFTPRPGTAPLSDLVLRCYPGNDGQTGTAVVYEDDGLTSGYQHGERAITALTTTWQGDQITITAAPTDGTFTGQPATRRCIVELPCTAKLTSCTGAAATTAYDEQTHTNRIELPAASIHLGWSLSVHAARIDPKLLTQRAIDEHLQDLLGEPYTRWQAKHISVPDDMQNAFAAVQGYGLFEQNLHPYLLGHHTVLLYCQNLGEMPKSLSVVYGDSQNAVQLPLGADRHVPGLNAPGDFLVGTEPVKVGASDGEAAQFVLTAPTWAYRNDRDDLALRATATASSGSAAAAIDGSVEGFPRDQSKEWVTRGQRAGAWIKLTWPAPVRVSTVYLYDRPNLNDHVLSGSLEFDDGTTMPIGELPNDGQLPGKISFSARMVQSIKVTITGVSRQTENAGLSEIAVFEKP